ncbi:hypothetical protein ARMSODRAFT_844667, partial [Armillaria solidipes]
GGRWKDILAGYKVFEGRAGFGDLKGSSHTLPSNNRPPEVAAWIKNYRRIHPDISEASLDSFAAKWWKWWIGMQPEWRDVLGKEGPLEISDRVRKGSDWSGLNKPGQNGLISVVVSLAWW